MKVCVKSCATLQPSEPALHGTRHISQWTSLTITASAQGPGPTTGYHDHEPFLSRLLLRSPEPSSLGSSRESALALTSFDWSECSRFKGDPGPPSGELRLLPFSLLAADVKPDSASRFVPFTAIKLPTPILIGVNPPAPELTGVKPPFTEGVVDISGVASAISVSDFSGVPTAETALFRADAALTAGESGPRLPRGEFAGFSTALFAAGELCGEGVIGPPNSASICN